MLRAELKYEESSFASDVVLQCIKSNLFPNEEYCSILITTLKYVLLKDVTCDYVSHPSKH